MDSNSNSTFINYANSTGTVSMEVTNVFLYWLYNHIYIFHNVIEKLLNFCLFFFNVPCISDNLNFVFNSFK